MLWATGVGAEIIRPMAAPVLGGLLIADEVIDIFLPVLYFNVQTCAGGSCTHPFDRLSSRKEGPGPPSFKGKPGPVQPERPTYRQFFDEIIFVALS